MISNLSQKFQFIFLSQNQSQKEVVVNENFNKIDCILNNGIISRSINKPPYNPNYADLYLTTNSPNDEWEDYPDHIAFFTSEWQFLKPSQGMIFVVLDEDVIIFYNKQNQWKVIKS